MHYWFKNSFAWTYRDLIEAVQQMILINSFAVLTCWDLLKQFNQLYFILIYFIHLTVLMCWDLIGAVQPIIIYWKSIEELLENYSIVILKILLPLHIEVIPAEIITVVEITNGQWSPAKHQTSTIWSKWTWGRCCPIIWKIYKAL